MPLAKGLESPPRTSGATLELDYDGLEIVDDVLVTAP